MSLRGRKFNASDVDRISSAESFADEREPSLKLGNFVILNSGGPIMIVVDLDGPAVVASWCDRAGQIYEHRFPAACVHRVSPASARTGEQAA